VSGRLCLEEHPGNGASLRFQNPDGSVSDLTLNLSSDSLHPNLVYDTEFMAAQK
jgi:hypothetical protein